MEKYEYGVLISRYDIPQGGEQARFVMYSPDGASDFPFESDYENALAKLGTEGWYVVGILTGPLRFYMARRTQVVEMK